MKIKKFGEFGKVNEGHVNFTDIEKEAIRKATSNFANNAVENFIDMIGNQGYDEICNKIKIDITDKLDELGYGNPGEIDEKVKQAFINMLTESLLKMFESFEEDKSKERKPWKWIL